MKTDFPLKFFRLSPLLFFALLAACTATPPPTISSVPTSNSHSPAPTITPIPTSSPTLVPSSTSTRTPVPTYTPRPIITLTPIPALYLLPDARTTECAEPLDIESTLIDVRFLPFCVFWVDQQENELGFRIVVEYVGGEVFAFEVDVNTTKTVIPDQYSPRTYESQENCSARGAFALSVYAILPEAVQKIEQLYFEGECPFTTLPSATLPAIPPY